MSSDEEILKFTVEVARQAGDVLLHYFGGALTRNIKSSAEDFATEADIAAEKLILSAIVEKFPDDAIVAEESGNQTGTSGYTWIVDPLDGTYNFANGSTNFGVMITRAREDTLDLAVVFNPKRNILAVGRRGGGVRLNEERVQIDSSAVADEYVAILDRLPKGIFIKRARAMRHKTLKVASTSDRWAAAGLVINALHFRLPFISSTPPGKVWDHAPQAFLLAEAGWQVTNFNGEPYVWHRDTEGFVAAVPAVHQKVMASLVN